MRVLRFWQNLLFAIASLTAISAIAKTPVIPEWGRFEQSFESVVSYTNPVQQAELTVTFVSPGGQPHVVPGFWDGSATWRVRFMPDEPGNWIFRTRCSDSANTGLDNHSGSFICSAPLGEYRFDVHGPIQVAHDGRHFEHADGAPFFWLADTVWDGARKSSAKDWAIYALIRDNQKFTAAQWSVIPGTDDHAETAFTGFDRVTINPQFFQRLDEKADTFNDVGLLNIIAPFWEANQQTTDLLPESQVSLLIRYMQARWGANDVAWLIAPHIRTNDPAADKKIARWRRIGGAAFGGSSHAPVILYAGEFTAMLEDFNSEKWVDAFGYQGGGDDSVPWMFGGALEAAWRRQPNRPFLNILPPSENSHARNGRISADEVRRAAWRSVFAAPFAGVTYTAYGVADWNAAPGPQAPADPANGLPFWEKALFLPGAKQVALMGTVLATNDFAGLRPARDALAGSAASASGPNLLAGAENADWRFGLFYTPAGQGIELRVTAIPPTPVMTWINPRTGGRQNAVAVLSGNSCEVSPPDAGDWLLLIRAGQ